MKTQITAPVVLFLLLAFTSCERPQAQALAMRDDFQRQLQAKERAIEEINRRVADLENENHSLREKAAKNVQDTGSAEKFSAAVNEATSRALQPLSADVAGMAEKISAAVNEATSRALHPLSADVAGMKTEMEQLRQRIQEVTSLFSPAAPGTPQARTDSKEKRPSADPNRKNP